MNQGPYGGPPPSGYGPPSYPQQGYPAPQGYGPPQKKGMSGCMIALIVFGVLVVCMFGGCLVLGMIGASASRQVATTASASATAATASAPPAPVPEAAYVDIMAKLPAAPTSLKPTKTAPS